MSLVDKRRKLDLRWTVVTQGMNDLAVAIQEMMTAYDGELAALNQKILEIQVPVKTPVVSPPTESKETEAKAGKPGKGVGS